MYTYNPEQWLSFFYIYCFFGWIFESAYVSIKSRRFVNRGFLRLPLLPLYGFGAVMMLWVSLPFQNSLFLVYLSGVIAATALEYVTGYVMEMLFKVRYWDYSGKKFQIHGYICLSSSIAWGFLTILLTEVIHQPVSDFIRSLPPSLLRLSLITVSALFIADTYESVREALALGKTLEAMTRLQEEIEDLQARIAALREEAAERVSSARGETAERLSSLRAEAEERLQTVKEETAERLASVKSGTAERLTFIRTETSDRLISIKEETAGRLAHLNRQLEDAIARRRALRAPNRLRRFYRIGLLKGNPGASSSRFSDALQELRTLLEQKNE